MDDDDDGIRLLTSPKRVTAAPRSRPQPSPQTPTPDLSSTTSTPQTSEATLVHSAAPQRTPTAAEPSQLSEDQVRMPPPTCLPTGQAKTLRGTLIQPTTPILDALISARTRSQFPLAASMEELEGPLGTAPGFHYASLTPSGDQDEELYQRFLANQAPDDEEEFDYIGWEQRERSQRQLMERKLEVPSKEVAPPNLCDDAHNPYARPLSAGGELAARNIQTL